MPAPKSLKEAAALALPAIEAKMDAFLARAAQDDERREFNELHRSVEYQSVAGVLLRLDEHRRQSDKKMTELESLKERLGQLERLVLLLPQKLMEAQASRPGDEFASLLSGVHQWLEHQLIDPEFKAMMAQYRKNAAIQARAMAHQVTDDEIDADASEWPARSKPEEEPEAPVS